MKLAIQGKGRCDKCMQTKVINFTQSPDLIQGQICDKCLNEVE